MDQSKNYEWKPQLAVGKKGELVVSQWLRQTYPVVRDVRGSPLWRSRDVDFLVQGYQSEAEPTTVEVKTDTYDNCRLFFELFNGSYMPGALLRSRADYWLYYKSANGILFQFRPHYVAAYIMDRIEDMRPLVQIRNQKGNAAAFGVNLTVQELYDADPGVGRFVLDGEDNRSCAIGLATGVQPVEGR